MWSLVTVRGPRREAGSTGRGRPRATQAPESELKYGKSEAKSFARTNLRGIWAAALSPFDGDLRLDEAGFRRNIRHWTDELGIDGLFISGKQGEFFSMTVEERKRTFEI